MWIGLIGIGEVRPGDIMRRAAKIDRNQVAIVQALRQIGCSVLPLHTVGHGCPDLLAARHPVGNVLLEVKDGTLAPSRRRLTPDELAFHGSWLGPVYVVESADDAIKIMSGQK